MASGRRITVTLDEAAERHLKGLKANSEMNLLECGWELSYIRRHQNTSMLVRSLLKRAYDEVYSGSVPDEARN